MGQFFVGRTECSGVTGQKNNTCATSEAIYLTFELTGYVLIVGARTVADSMRKLAKPRIHFSIDDFGTSQFGLGSPRRSPLRGIKIDDSFVQDICDDANVAARVELLLSLAHHLHVQAVAQGAECDVRRRLLTARLPANARTSIRQTVSGATRAPPQIRRR